MIKNEIENIDDLIARAVELENQSEAEVYSSSFEPPPAGAAVARLIEYIELGNQPRKAYKGKDKPPAPEVRVTFELLSPRNVKKVEADGTEVEIADKISLKLVKSKSDKSKFFKLFQTLRRGRTEITHMAQMLGEAFRLTVVHNSNGETGEKARTYANIERDGAFLIEAPIYEDPVTNTITNIPVRQAVSPRRLFLWDRPTPPSWNSLYIQGERTTKDESGAEVTKSKNFLQELALSATNFNGSPLQQMLAGANELPKTMVTTKAEAVAEIKETTAKKETKKEAKNPSVDAALAELGIG